MNKETIIGVFVVFALGGALFFLLGGGTFSLTSNTPYEFIWKGVPVSCDTTIGDFNDNGLAHYEIIGRYSTESLSADATVSEGDEVRMKIMHMQGGKIHKNMQNSLECEFGIDLSNSDKFVVQLEGNGKVDGLTESSLNGLLSVGGLEKRYDFDSSGVVERSGSLVSMTDVTFTRSGDDRWVASSALKEKVVTIGDTLKIKVGTGSRDLAGNQEILMVINDIIVEGRPIEVVVEEEPEIISQPVIEEDDDEAEVVNNDDVVEEKHPWYKKAWLWFLGLFS